MKLEFRKSCLKGIKKNVAINNYVLAERTKNKGYMDDNDLNLDDLKSAILALTPNDCCDGPESDRDGYAGYVFEFKSNSIEERITYLKIRYNPPDEVVCISFHEDEKL